MENKEKKGKINFKYINKKKIGAVIATAALVCVGLTAKSCTDSKFEADTNIQVGRIFKNIELPSINVTDIIKKLAEQNPALEEVIEEIQEENTNGECTNGENKNQNSNNQDTNNGGNNQPGSNPGTPGDNKPSEPDPKPVDPTPEEPEPPHVHKLVSNYEAHDENETCVVTKWQVCTDPKCPNGAGTHLNKTTIRNSHQYTPISEIEDPVGSGIWIITDMCTVCNHTQERSSRHSLSGYSMNVEAVEATPKQKTLKLY